MQPSVLQRRLPTSSCSATSATTSTRVCASLSEISRSSCALFMSSSKTEVSEKLDLADDDGYNEGDCDVILNRVAL